MRIGEPKEVVRVKEPALPYEGDEVTPERPARKEKEKVPAGAGEPDKI